MSKRIKVMSVFGTRPEAIKMAPLVLELQKHPEIESIVCITAQHREMLDSVMDCFGIRADYDLNIMQQGQDLTAITTRVLERMREVLGEVQPDIVLVHGDTTTTFAGAPRTKKSSAGTTRHGLWSGGMSWTPRCLIASRCLWVRLA